MPRLSLILTVIADDRPGLVGELSAAVSAHRGNWLESSMSQLAGKFAGIVKVEIDAQRADALKAALASLSGLKATAEISTPPADARGRPMSLSLVGHDRIGIVREVAAVLAKHAVNVEKLVTRTESGPMASGTLFRAEALLTAPPALDTRTLKADLEAISNDLMVEFSLGELV